MRDEHSNNEHEKVPKQTDADELREVAKALPELFGALNESIPKLISGLIGSVYSPEAAGNMASAIGKFYKNLIEEGIPEDVALDMTKKFVGALDFRKLISLIGDETSLERHGKGKHRKIKIDLGDDDDELDEEYDE